MKAVLQYRASPGFRSRLEAAAPSWLRIVVVPESDRVGFAAEMGDADVLLHVLEPVPADVIEAAPALKLIQKIGVGVNTIDLAAARARGVAVANMPGTNSQAVAEHALALMLAVLRRVVTLDRAMRAGEGWSLPSETFDRVGEIAGRTVGLIGYGEVPRRLAPVLAALGARVLYTCRQPKPNAAGEFRMLDSLLAESDIVSLHVPLTAATERLIGTRELARMKRGGVLINTARGGLVDERSLESALRSGHLLGAGLDVVAVEPTPSGYPLFALDNVVVSPHIAWTTPETFSRSLAIAIENCRRVRDGEPLLHRIE